MARPCRHFAVPDYHHTLVFAVLGPVCTENGPIGARIAYICVQDRSSCLELGFYLWISAKVRQDALHNDFA